MWTRGPLTFLLLLFLLLTSWPAAAQAPLLDCQQDAACLPLSQRATERFKAGDLTEALRLYKLAYDVRADPRLLYNIARALHKQGQTAEAGPYYQKFLDSDIQDEQQRQKAREYLSQLPHEPPAPTQPNPTAVSANVLVESTHTDASPTRKPIYKKWWFWTVLGVAAAGVAIGTGVGLASREPDLLGVEQYPRFGASR